jgi:hypothetical protein
MQITFKAIIFAYVVADFRKKKLRLLAIGKNISKKKKAGTKLS